MVAQAAQVAQVGDEAQAVGAPDSLPVMVRLASLLPVGTSAAESLVPTIDPSRDRTGNDFRAETTCHKIGIRKIVVDRETALVDPLAVPVALAAPAVVRDTAARTLIRSSRSTTRACHCEVDCWRCPVCGVST